MLSVRDTRTLNFKLTKILYNQCFKDGELKIKAFQYFNIISERSKLNNFRLLRSKLKYFKLAGSRLTKIW